MLEESSERIESPVLIEGGMHVDHRGSLGHVNGFSPAEADRVYWIRSHAAFTPRGWVGHKVERKWFCVIQGTLCLAVVKPDDWQAPSAGLPVARYVLTGGKPQVLAVPPGYATANAALSGDAILLVYSTGRAGDSAADDYRFPVDAWKVLPD